MSDLTVGEVVLWLLSWEAPTRDSDERDVCVACKQPCTRPPELEPSALCNLCAQEWVQKFADDIAKREARKVELLALVARISQETPLPDEFKGWTEQRAKLIAEVGTLRSEVADVRREIAEMRRADEDRRAAARAAMEAG